MRLVASVVLAAALLVATASRAQAGSDADSLALSGPRVVFRPRGGTPAESVAARCRAALLRRGADLAEAILPADADPQAVVCLLLPTDLFQQRFAGRLPDWGIAVALPGGRVIAIDWQRQGAGGGPRGIEDVFLHELAHAMLEQGLAGVAAPRWFHEGVAVNQSGEWRLVDGVALLFEGRPPRLASLTSRFPAGDAGARQAYRASALAVRALRQRHGEDIVPRLLSAATLTHDFDAAFKEVTGEATAGFTTRFDRGLSSPWAWAVRVVSWPALWVLLALLVAGAFFARRAHNRRRLKEMTVEEASRKGESSPPPPSVPEG